MTRGFVRLRCNNSKSELLRRQQIMGYAPYIGHGDGLDLGNRLVDRLNTT